MLCQETNQPHLGGIHGDFTVSCGTHFTVVGQFCFLPSMEPHPPSDFGLGDTEMTDSWTFQGITFYFLELSSLESSTSMLFSEALVGSRRGSAV